MNIVFSEIIVINKINYTSQAKLFGTTLYNGIMYKLVCPYHSWITENTSIFGYGLINHNTKYISLETVIPNLKSQKQLFTLFLLSMNIKGLSKTKIDLLNKAFDGELYNLFFENKFDMINGILQYEDNKLNYIIHKWQEINIYCLLHIDLIKLGLSAKYIKKVYKIYKQDSIKIIKENPYQMIESIGFGFKTVDQIALEYGINKNNMMRIEQGLLYVLYENELLGSTYIEKNILYEKSKELLQINNDELLIIAFNNLIIKKKTISIANKWIGLYSVYMSELFIFNFLQKNKNNLTKNICLQDAILSDEQKVAVKGAIENQYSVITGSAGSGKSTVIKTIYHLQKQNNKHIIVLAPTGRASQRIKEIDESIESATIHKLLKQNNIYQFKNSIDVHVGNYLQYDHIIIDECSMIDSVLLYILLKGMKTNTQITFIGDVSQLPPIGMGMPFTLCIEYTFIAVYYLTKIFRQNEKTTLLIVAKDISKGIYPKISSQTASDCCFKNVKKEDLYILLVDYIDKYYDKKNQKLDLQWVTFLNRGVCGVHQVNTLIQNHLHQKYKCDLPLLINRFYRYDKVVVLKNNYQLDIRNGEIGIVVDGNENEIVIEFEANKIVNFSVTDANILQLAYAINVYKSQGSEFKNVLILLYMEQYILLNKKALYTALTRAKQKAIIIGERKAFYCTINNKNNNKRNTFLELFLQKKKLFIYSD